MNCFWGEFLISPMPLEWSDIGCSNACFYCFVSMRRNQKCDDLKKTISLVSNFHDRKTAVAYLLQQHAPVLISNRSDPFANGNFSRSSGLLSILVSLGIGVSIQTKGFYSDIQAQEILSLLPPSVWYISLSFWDETLRKSIEPNAPVIASRLELIRALTDKGHSVIVGVNPLVPEWLPDNDIFHLLDSIRAAGAVGAWFEFLHIGRNQREVDKYIVSRLGREIVLRAGGLADEVEIAFLSQARHYAKQIGLEVYTYAQSEPSNFHAPFYHYYPTAFPVNQIFVNWCFSNLEDYKRITFDDYWRVMGERLPQGQHLIENYIRVGQRALFLKYSIPARMTYQDALKLGWKLPGLNYSLLRHACFAKVVDDSGQPVIADDGLPYLCFSRNWDEEGGE